MITLSTNYLPKKPTDVFFLKLIKKLISKYKYFAKLKQERARESDSEKTRLSMNEQKSVNGIQLLLYYF